MISTTLALFIIGSTDPSNINNESLQTVLGAALKALANSRYMKVTNEFKWLDVSEFWYLSSNSKFSSRHSVRLLLNGLTLLKLVLAECIASNHSIPNILANVSSLCTLLEMISKMYSSLTDEELTVLRVLVTSLSSNEGCKVSMKKVLTPGLLHKLGWGNIKSLLNS
jgi:hypothetical protein